MVQTLPANININSSIKYTSIITDSAGEENAKFEAQNTPITGITHSSFTY